jgi:voltage-gated potassium channel
MKKSKKLSLSKYIRKNKKTLNEISIIINIFFLFVLLFEFFVPNSIVLRDIQIILWIFFIWELIVRILMHKKKLRHIFNIYNIIDLAIIWAIFIRYYYWDHALLHFFTALKVLRSYRVIHDLSNANKFIDRNKDLIFSILNLVIFIFFMASLVFVFQVERNDWISSFLDALYFTLATLTTTGFWDITVIWDTWKVLAILIMTLWTGLFLRLVSVLFRPIKKYSPCKHCWLKKHDKDASHCKHCGNIIYIENDWEAVD